jgi:hypothetical protein
MPRLDFHEDAWRLLQALPPEMRKEILQTASQLLATPTPDDAEPYADIPSAYVLRTGFVTIYYRAITTATDVDIDVLVVRPNS